MNIWIDLANSPQVLFFRPLIPELQRFGHAVTITSRHFAQTTQLADLYGLDHTPIGGHGGKRLFRIGLTILERAGELARFARGKKFDLAVSHTSYAQALAAAALRIPFVTLMDYEHQPANHLCFRLARRVIVPEFFPRPALHKYGAAPEKTQFYHGLKEQMYLADFSPQEDYLQATGIPNGPVLVVMRPPASWTLYHHFDNPLFDQALAYAACTPETFIVFLPRIPLQGEMVRAKGYPNVWIPPQALDGPNLLYHAHVVISAGGSMNREAAVLGTPAYSLFAGKLAAVDQYLIAQGRMQHIAAEQDIHNIKIIKNQRQERMAGGKLVLEIVDQILGLPY